MSANGGLRRLFVNDEPRLRAGWRLLLFLLLLILLQIGVGLIVVAAGALRGVMPLPGASVGPVSVLLQTLLAAVFITGAVYLARRWLDRRSFVSLGLRPRPPWLRDLAAGIALGVVLQACIFAVEWAAGWLVVEGVGWRWRGGAGAAVDLSVLVLAFMAVAWQEELMTRGYLFQNVEDGLNTGWAVVLTSLLFGVLHWFNPNASLAAVLGISVAGLLLAVAYLVTRALWLPIGLHFAWNFAEGPLFGFPVSGIDFGGVIQQRAVGPVVITGGDFGPEGGLIAVAAGALGIGLCWLYGRWRARA